MVEDFDSLLPHCLDPVTSDERAFVKVGQASLVEAGLVSLADLQTAQRLLLDPAFIANLSLMITAWGRKPG